MTFFLISASLFKQHRDQSIQRVFDIIGSAPAFGEIVILTEPEAGNTYLTPPQKQTAEIVTLDSSLWLDPYTSEVAIIAFRQQIESVKHDQIILIDSTYYKIETIQTILTEISWTGFKKNSWYSALILIVDDINLTHVRASISETFFIKSLPISSQEISSDYNNMTFKIIKYRWLSTMMPLKFKKYAKYILKKLRRI
jgi:hypothetical protein